MRLRPECRRARIRNPNLDRAQPLGAKPDAMFADLHARRLGAGCFARDADGFGQREAPDAREASHGIRGGLILDVRRHGVANTMYNQRPRYIHRCRSAQRHYCPLLTPLVLFGASVPEGPLEALSPPGSHRARKASLEPPAAAWPPPPSVFGSSDRRSPDWFIRSAGTHRRRHQAQPDADGKLRTIAAPAVDRTLGKRRSARPCGRRRPKSTPYNPYPPSTSASVSATTSVALYKSASGRRSSARWALASSIVWGPAP